MTTAETVQDSLIDLERKIGQYLRDKTAEVSVEDSTGDGDPAPMFTVRVAWGDQQRLHLQFRGHLAWLQEVRSRATVIEAVGQKVEEAKRAGLEKSSSTTPSSSKVGAGKKKRGK